MSQHFAQIRLPVVGVLGLLAIGAYALTTLISGADPMPSNAIVLAPTIPTQAATTTPAPPASTTDARVAAPEDPSSTPEIELLLTQLRREQTPTAAVLPETQWQESLAASRDEADRAQNNGRLNPSHAPLLPLHRETLADGLARFDVKRKELEAELPQLRLQAFTAAVRTGQYRVVRRLRPGDDPRVVESNPKVVTDQLVRQLGVEGRDWVLKRLHGHQQVTLVYTMRNQAPKLFQRMDAIRSLEEQRRQWLESYMLSRSTPLPRGI